MGDQLAINDLDDGNSGRGVRHRKLLRSDGGGHEVVGVGAAQGRQPGDAVFGNQFPRNVSLQDVEILGVVNGDKICRVAHPQQADIQAVVQHRIDTGYPQDLKQVGAHGQRSFDQAVDVPGNEAIRMLVVRTKHHGFVVV